MEAIDIRELRVTLCFRFERPDYSQDPCRFRMPGLGDLCASRDYQRIRKEWTPCVRHIDR